MQLNNRDLKSIIDNEALAYAMYTVENRAIPNMIDGFKPVQRLLLLELLIWHEEIKISFTNSLLSQVV